MLDVRLVRGRDVQALGELPEAEARLDPFLGIAPGEARLRQSVQLMATGKSGS